MSCLVMEYSAVVDLVHDSFWLGVVSRFTHELAYHHLVH